MGDFNELGQIALRITQSKGFMLSDNEDTARQIALMHTELSEALEADRMDKYSNPLDINAGEIISDPEHFQRFYEENIKGTFEEEMADIIIRVLQFSAYKKLDLDSHVKFKMRYNAERPFKHGNKKY